MGAGAFVSALLHGSVIALALIAWPRLMPPIDLSEQVVPVDILPTSEETNIAPQAQSEKPVEEPTPQPPPPAPQVAAEEPPPPPEPDTLAMPEPLPPPPIPVEPTPSPTPTQRFANVHPRSKPKPDKAKPDFDINKIAGLVDKLSKEPKPEAPPAPTKPAQATRSTTGVGAQTAMTMSEIDALRSQMMKCWNVPVGAPDPTALILRVKVLLNQDGSVAGMPQLLDTMGLSDPYFRAAADSAIRAVKMCEPYKLPADKYEAWSEVTVTFDPTKMAGY
jgi:outer membrane biosynthesis protein TonB